jgi:glycosidase
MIEFLKIRNYELNHNHKSLEAFLTPHQRFPHSLDSQLNYLKNEFSNYINEYRDALIKTIDFLYEENRPHFAFGHGEIKKPGFEGLSLNASYSKDLPWMQNLVLISKHIYVWLNQLAKKYNKAIDKLDQIPDQELADLSEKGFTALWMVGIWSRSKISKKIKHKYGNKQAIASAYSLYDYTISQELGGEAAFNNLQERASKYNLKIACDIVPNHMGLDSKWLLEDPELFINSEHLPYPAYTFEGENLSDDPDIKLYLEDGYWSKTEAAVVFKYENIKTGVTKYIYHGNDGSSIPWNDTAQLNYFLPKVRELLITTIINIAKKFPVLRLDAAMSLTKKHFQRLWYPQPGHGGDIPSRIENSMTQAEFDKYFSEEFWSELIIRLKQEAPETLLIAEAFWLMENYFVHTLGVHRVYNCAFLHMLRGEENQQYRSLIKEILEYEPQILERYVNYMSNPDEDSVYNLFEGTEKYRGICVLMSTLPGLPMFAHGQFEGYTEKYAMDSNRAIKKETIKKSLLNFHKNSITPLLKRRAYFCRSNHFQLYDFIDKDGNVCENVYIFTNRNNNKNSLVIFNNSAKPVEGNFKLSLTYKDNTVIKETLIESLQLENSIDSMIIFTDMLSSAQFKISYNTLLKDGFALKLKPYHYHVFLNIK